MERNEETLSTRDLAASNESARGVATAEDGMRDGAAPDGQRAASDQSYHERPRPVDEDAQLVTDGRTSGDSRANPTPAVTGPDQDTDPAPSSTSASISASDAAGSLLPGDMDATFQERWKQIQTRFVDEPRGAVEDAVTLSPTSCSNSQRASLLNGRGWKRSGAVGRTSPLRICGSPCSAIGPSSSGCCRPEGANREHTRRWAPRADVQRRRGYATAPTDGSLALPGRVCGSSARKASTSWGSNCRPRSSAICARARSCVHASP